MKYSQNWTLMLQIAGPEKSEMTDFDFSRFVVKFQTPRTSPRPGQQMLGSHELNPFTPVTSRESIDREKTGALNNSRRKLRLQIVHIQEPELTSSITAQHRGVGFQLIAGPTHGLPIEWDWVGRCGSLQTSEFRSPHNLTGHVERQFWLGSSQRCRFQECQDHADIDQQFVVASL